MRFDLLTGGLEHIRVLDGSGSCPAQDRVGSRWRLRGAQVVLQPPPHLKTLMLLRVAPLQIHRSSPPSRAATFDDAWRLKAGVQLATVGYGWWEVGIAVPKPVTGSIIVVFLESGTVPGALPMLFGDDRPERLACSRGPSTTPYESSGACPPWFRDLVGLYRVLPCHARYIGFPVSTACLRFR